LFTDDELTAVMRAALRLPVEKRNRLLQVIAERLELPDGHYSQSGLDNAVRSAVRQLIQEFSRPPGTILRLDRDVHRVRKR
jgi:hypothetical protein